MPEISAVVFSNLATVGKVRALTKELDPRKMIFSFLKYNQKGLHPIKAVVEKENYTENLEDGLTIFINPYAKNPISQDIVSLFPGFSDYDDEMKCVLGEANDGNLINRMVSVFTESES